MFNEERAAELAAQQKNLSLVSLFPNPRPMWMAPAFIATFGDAFIDNTAFEGASNLAWSFMVLNHALQRTVQQSTILSALPPQVRVNLSDCLHIMQQSALVFKLMLKMLKVPNESQLLSFIKKLKKVLAALAPCESLLLPVFVEGRELVMIIERTSERYFKFVVVQTDSAGLGHHTVSAVEFPPLLSFRTCLVLNAIPKKNALDDVFWVALYNLCIHSHQGDMLRFYDILLPFLTGKPLESSLVEAETAATDYFVSVADIQEKIIDKSNRTNNEVTDESIVANRGLFGSWRLPQMSKATYVRCVLEALHFLLTSRGASDIQIKQVNF